MAQDVKDIGQRRKEYDIENPQVGDKFFVYDTDNTTLGYGLAVDDGYGLQWEACVPSPTGVYMSFGVEDTRQDAEMAIREWFDDA